LENKLDHDGTHFTTDQIIDTLKHMKRYIAEARCVRHSMAYLVWIRTGNIIFQKN
jgi:hypothetical protein